MKLCYSIEDVKKLVIEHAENVFPLTVDQVNTGGHLKTTVKDRYATDFIEVELIMGYEKEEI